MTGILQDKQISLYFYNESFLMFTLVYIFADLIYAVIYTLKSFDVKGKHFI